MIIGSIIGILGALIPELFKSFKQWQDDKHELKILDRQMKLAENQHQYKLEEINVKADISESKALYKTYNVGIRWIDALNGSVRPMIAYSFFALYAYVKITQSINAPWNFWTETDEAIFVAVISFYFGKRSLEKGRAFSAK